MNVDSQSEPPTLPPPLPPPIPSRAVLPTPTSSFAATIIGAIVGFFAGAVASIAIVFLVAFAAGRAADLGSGGMIAWGVYGLCAVLFVVAASAAAFGFRSVTSSLSAVPVVAIVLAREWLRRAPAPDPSQLFAFRLDTTLGAALIWSVAGALFARRLTRPPTTGDTSDHSSPTKGKTNP